jgi:positive phototaxis protein PixI
VGLIVQSVSDMEWCDPDRIQSPPAATMDSEILKFSQGYWVNATGDMLMVLDIRSLFAELPRAAI